MAIHCVFFTPGGKHRCQVLRMIGSGSLQQRTQRTLEERYCASGAFIACPVFMRVERGLNEVNQLRAKTYPYPPPCQHQDQL